MPEINFQAFGSFFEYINTHGVVFTSIVTLIGVTVALIQSSFTKTYYFRQISAIRVTQTLAFLNEFRQSGFKIQQHHVLSVISSKLIQDPDFSKRGYRGLDKDDKPALEQVSYFFDYVGHVQSTGYLDERLLLTTIARPIIDQWSVIAPLLMKEREIRRNLTKPEKPTIHHRYVERYQSGFEHLAAIAYRFTQRRALSEKEVKFKLPIRKLSGFD